MNCWSCSAALLPEEELCLRCGKSQIGGGWVECQIGYRRGYCEVGYRRGYLYGEFTADYQNRAEGDLAGLSGRFPWVNGGDGLARTRAAEIRLMELCRELEGQGWEERQSAKEPEPWYQRSLRLFVGQPEHAYQVPSPDALEVVTATEHAVPNGSSVPGVAARSEPDFDAAGSWYLPPPVTTQPVHVDSELCSRITEYTTGTE